MVWQPLEQVCGRNLEKFVEVGYRKPTMSTAELKSILVGLRRPDMDREDGAPEVSDGSRAPLRI
jgi:hypothetical protein